MQATVLSVCGKTKDNKNKDLRGQAGHMCDECDGDGPPKGGVLGNEIVMRTSQCVATRGKCVTKAMKTAHQNVDSRETKMQQNQAIVWARDANV